MSADSKKRIAEQLELWQSEILDPLVARRPLRKESFQTSSGLDLPPVTTPADPGVPGLASYAEGLGFPGQFPYTRGVQPTMYRGRLWTMRQYAGFGTAEESNARYRYLLGQGQTGLSVAFDLPTQMGYDSDAEEALGEVGRVGVAIDSVEDMATLFRDIPLDKVSTSMTINSTASILLALYIAVGKRQGVQPAQLRGTLQNDILKEYIARGTYIYPPRPSMRLITDMFSWCAENTPRWNTISISGYHIREAGSSAAQELAFTLADGVAYVEAALDAGLEVDVFAPRLSFFFNAHNNFLEEVAKFRAARRLWAGIMRDRFGAKRARSMQLRFHTQVAGSTLAATQVDNNVVRVAIQALAAVLGGTQSLHTNAKDEALGLPLESTATLALRTQQVIAHETGVADFVDPLGGSYAIESLTDELEASALAMMAEIDALGGMVAAIEQGYPQREIQHSAYLHQVALERGEKQVVGVNAFEDEGEESTPAVLKMNPALESEQCERLAACRSRRDSARAKETLEALGDAASGTANTQAAILRAVEAHATVGEIADTLRAVFGEYREKVVL
jgi:methylmalonyl-CoA mutase N-terminal domain/subunit